ncbi:MAG: anaerobic ribonucleoside-triphosphate reductase [Candidatus Woesearchaeota archaeon]
MNEPCKCDVYSRVVGYFRPVDNWNEGKRAEYEERKEFVVQRESVHTSDSLVDWQGTPKKCILVTTPSCPNCTYVKKHLEKNEFPFEIADATTTAGFDLAKKHQISSVPSAIFMDEQDETVTVELGQEKILSFLAKI